MTAEAAVDRCVNGHERTEENTRWNGNERVCKPCRREISRRYAERLHANGKKRKRAPDKRAPRPVSEADIARIKARVSINESGCWIWQGGINPENGYGYTRAGGRVRSVHRLLYEALVGEVPDGLVLDHLCRTPACGNPAHLQPVTQRTNLLRGDNPAWRTHRARHGLDEFDGWAAIERGRR